MVNICPGENTRRVNGCKMKMPNINSSNTKIDFEQDVRMHINLLGHKDLGVTELRVFDPVAQVAYADDTDNVVQLAMQMDGKTTGIYVGVQPRPLRLYDFAPIVGFEHNRSPMVIAPVTMISNISRLCLSI